MAGKIKVILDTLENKPISSQCKQNDDLVLEAYIYEGDEEVDLTNSYIVIQARKSDLKPIIQDININKIGNKIIAELDREFTRVPGVTVIEIVIIEEGKQSTTFNFVLIVEGSVINTIIQSGIMITPLEKLQNTLVEANTTNVELKNTTIISKDTDGILKNTVNIAVEANVKAEENINNLNLKNTAADTNISTLTLKNTKAEENITNLETKNTEAVTNIAELETKIAAAGEVKAETELLIQNGGAATKVDIAKVNTSLEQKANETEVVKKGYGTLNDFNEETRRIIQGMESGNINAVLGKENVRTENIAEKNITPSRISFRKINKEKNQFNKNDLIKTGYYSNTGVWKSDTTIHSTQFIEVEAHVKLLTNIYSYICFWDINKTLIQGFINSNTKYATTTYDIPSNCKYITSSYQPSVNTESDKLFLLLSYNYYDTVEKIPSLMNVEYFDENLYLDSKNILNLDNEVKKAVKDLENIDINESHIILPDKIYTTINELISYINPLLINGSYEIRVSYSTGATEWGKRSYNFSDFDWSKVPNNATVNIIIANNGIVKYKKDVVVIKKTSNPTTKEINLMCIGDSITNRGLANSIQSYLKVKYGLEVVNCIGTMQNNNSKMGEGREGWKFTNFIGKDWVSQNGANITPILTKSNGSLITNPFVRVATISDDTDKCFAFNNEKYIFDFSNYLNVQNIDIPDVVTIALSTNDILSGNVNYIDDCLLALKIMIDSIKTNYPNIKIGVIPTFNFGMDKIGNDLQKKALLWTKKCINFVSTLNSPNIFIVPSYLFTDRATAYPLISNSIEKDNLNISSIDISDNVHNNSVNVHANVIAQAIVNHLN